MNATKIARRFVETFECATACAVRHDDEWYIVTAATGDGCFAYLADEAEAGLDAVDAAVEAGLPEDVAPYQIYCDHATPSEDETLAAAVWLAAGKRICHAGSCAEVALDA